MIERRSVADLLDRVRVPDLWPDIQRRVPDTAAELAPPSRRRAYALVAAVVIGILGVGASIYALSGMGAERTEGPAPPALVGPLIAYSTTDTAPDLRIAVMRPDGSSATAVTTGKEPDEYVSRYGFSQDLDPQWSADGQRIYFLRRYSEAIYSLCSISPTGQGFQVLVRDFPAGIFALSPSGSEVSYGAGHAIHVMKVDGSDDRVVAHTPVTFPYGVPISWSPDGGRIVFSSGDMHLSIADVATGRVTTPLRGFRVDAVAWDPADRLIAFAGSRLNVPNISKFTEQVWVVRPDGTDLRLVSGGGSNWTAAGWSPDGTHLIVGRLDQRLRDDGLAVIGVDGTGLSIIQPSALSTWAAWRP
jgi:Tol biopolymer transport system component